MKKVQHRGSQSKTHARRLAAGLSLTALLIAPFPDSCSAGIAGTATVHFAGKSTLHGFEGKAPPIEVRPVFGEEGWHETVRLPVAELDTGNESRDRKMRELLEADAFPELVATFERVVPETLSGSGETDGELNFRLRIRDVEKNVTARIENFVRTDARASFDAVFFVSLDEFGLEAPSALFFMKVEDRIDVRVSVELERR